MTQPVPLMMLVDTAYRLGMTVKYSYAFYPSGLSDPATTDYPSTLAGHRTRPR